MAKINSAKEKEEFVHGVFQSIAHKYDRMNTLLSFGMHKYWRRFTMKKMNVQHGQTALDVACGTCDWTIALAKATGNPAGVYGLDFSENMLRIGRQKLDKENLGQVQLIHGSALDIPMEDNRVDFATIGFALRNVPDIERTLAEMARVVKPGGKVVSLELSKPTWPPFRLIYYLYFNHILPLLGKLFANRYEQYRWLPESLKNFPDHKELEAIFRKVGLVDVKSYPLTGGIVAVHIGTKQE
jgi:demethylmenaquinone methyltransferase/2-methoxy-6-polyprenyl-1,4-benzoquinol methylase